MVRTNKWLAAAFACLLVSQVSTARAQPCITVLHDEVHGKGPLHSLFLANLLGHWPQYERRIRSITTYKEGQTEDCKVTFYVGTQPNSKIPASFLSDFLKTKNTVAWVGFGLHELNQHQLSRLFKHRTDGVVQRDEDDEDDKNPGLYRYVKYKGSVFHKDVFTENGNIEAAFAAVKLKPSRKDAHTHVLASLIHNKSYATIPYFLRAGNKFIVTDSPFAYMHEGGRYFAFADLLFDILDEKPLRKDKIAFARIEDIYGPYDQDLLNATFATLRAENVPISIAHIPFFRNPAGDYGVGGTKKGRPSTDFPKFVKLVREVAKDKRNAIIWHGVTHQFGDDKNPYTGTSGDDYEFWDAVNRKPLEVDGVDFTLDRLARALPVFKKLGIKPRYWVTPHYRGSAISNTVFGDVFPWIIGRVIYYPTAFKTSFTIGAATRDEGAKRPAVDRKLIQSLKKKEWPEIDRRSEGGEGQLFPYEIYKDVYGQRVIPETLGYIADKTSEQTPFTRTVDKILGDARRNLVVRDYWASVFLHPYLFGLPQNGGLGEFKGDTAELQKLVTGLKLLGFRFVGLPEFEESLTRSKRTGDRARAFLHHQSGVSSLE